MADSNADEVEAWEKALIDSFDFTRAGTDQSLGRDMVGDVAAGIHDRTVDRQQNEDGVTLLPNKEPYRTRKRKKYGVDQPLVRTGQMTSQLSLIGYPEVSPDEIVMRYGTGDADADGVTDRAKAEWNSDDRPFYAMDDQIIDKLVDRAAEAFDKAARELQ